LLRPAGGRIFKILLASPRRDVEQRAGVGQRFGTARVTRPGVEDVIAELEEHAQPMLLAGDGVGHLGRFEFGLVAIIVFDRRDPRTDPSTTIRPRAPRTGSFSRPTPSAVGAAPR